MFGKSKDKQEQPTREERERTYAEFIAAEEELKQLRKEHGIEDPNQGKISHKVSSFFERQAGREPVAVNKKKYMWLAVLTGWFGGHRFYCKHYRVGLLYLAFFWIGLGLYNTVIDMMVVIPMQPDENGNILL